MRAITYLLVFLVPVAVVFLLIQNGVIIADHSSIKTISQKIEELIPGSFRNEKVETAHKPYSEKLVPNNNSIKIHIRKLLRNKQFSLLNNELEKFQKSTDENINAETNLYTAYDSFYINQNSLEATFDEWVEFSPENYQPYIARGSFYSSMGWNARGTTWASETKKEQFAKMNSYFDKAINDLNKAIALKNQCMVPYSRLMGMHNARGENGAEETVLKNALSINPISYKIREHYMNGITPRWGGSLDKMKSFAEKAQVYSSSNQKLTLLQGKPYIEAGDLASLNEVYSKAIKFYSRALEYGDNSDAYFKRGKAYKRSDNFQKALGDFNRAITLYSENGEYFHWRARTYVGLEQYDKAKDDILMANSLEPEDETILEYIEWIAYAYSKKARKDIDNNQYDSAIEEIKTAIELDKNNINHLLLLDWLLAKKHDWDQIIQYWDEFIERTPDNSRAYVERGGAYYRKGDMNSAVENARIAANMGNAEGKEAYEKFKHFIK